jgi:hypothetical protein
MTEITYDQVPVRVLKSFSRNSKQNADFLFNRAAELHDQAKWYEEHTPDAERAGRLRESAASISDRAWQILAFVEPIDAELISRGGQPEQY